LYDIKNIDLAIIPAVAYDFTGNRIGRGKGYYDRLLQNANIFKIGIVYDFQIMPAVPTTAYDQPVDIVISNRRLIYTKILFEK
jgi:5-formyltetrahydrofolate cyclo-ligase